MWWPLSGARGELALFAKIGFAMFGLEHLVFDAIWWGRRAWRSATVYRRHDRATMATLAPPRAPGRFAVLIGAWDEAAVIAATLTTMLERWGDSDYRVYVATYPNDPGTLAEIERVRATSLWATAHIRVVPGMLDGPTTKAEALNRAFTALRIDEDASGLRYKGILLHDAEDYVSPHEIALFDSLIERFALVQIPVRPLKRAGRTGVAGHYLDEFSEAHGQHLVVREAVGASVPCAGTGCAIARDMLAALAAQRGGAPFDSDSLTEDYEMGLRIGRLGGRGILARLRDRPGGALVAVEAYFPHRGRAAIRQKARWVTGIALAGWDRIGWAGGFRETWMRMRDRSAPLAAAVLAAGYAAMLLALIETGLAWRAEREGPILTELDNPLGRLLIGLLLWRLAMRAFLVGQLYGPGEALRSIPRMMVSNLVAIAATARALWHYVADAPLRWDKTAHSLPDDSDA